MYIIPGGYVIPDGYIISDGYVIPDDYIYVSPIGHDDYMINNVYTLHKLTTL